MRSTILDLEVIFIHKTDRAYLVKSDEDAEKIWLPASLVEIDGPLVRNSVVTVSLPTAFAQEKGLI